jgi:hypothetical protein
MKIYYNKKAMSYFGEKLQNKLKLDYVELENINTEDEVFWFGVYSVEDFETLLKTENKINLHWCGTDAFWCGANGYLEKLTGKKNIYYSCASRMIRDYLSRYGIGAVFAPTFSGDMSKIKYSPRDYSGKLDVLVYEPGKALYMPNEMVEVANRLPNVQFHWFGCPEDVFKGLPSNIKNHGRLKWGNVLKLMKKCQIFIRYTEHDGFPNTVIEAVLSGMSVITNHQFPFTYRVNEVEDIVQAIRNIKKDGHDGRHGNWYYRESGFLNNWDTILNRAKLPTVSIGIVDSGRNKKWFEAALRSAQMQTYRVDDILVLDNPIDENGKYQMGVGKAYNSLAKQCKSDYLYILGDDDYISNDMIYSMVVAITNAQAQMDCIVSAHSYTAMVDGDKLGYSPSIPTGMWLLKYLKEYPFDENLKKLVDTELIDRTRKNGFVTSVAIHHFGYFYRQHDNMVSGRKTAKEGILEVAKIEAGGSKND